MFQLNLQQKVLNHEGDLIKHLKFHKFRKNDKLNIQDDYIFFDTETKRKNNRECFELGWLIYYNRKTTVTEKLFFERKNDFFKYVMEKMFQLEHLFIFAHNTDFDIKVLGGIDYFVKNGYEVKSFYIEGCRYVVKLMKDEKIIEILDTMNYIPLSLEKIGESIGLNKMKIDFNNCTRAYLKEYCLNDCEIVFLFIKKLLDFLEEYELSKLMPTVSSLSLNIFRHKFYDKKYDNFPFYVHAWKSVIDLERLSYKGGITDCFKIGNFTDKQYKLDINSMYPYQMKNNYYPSKLLYYRDITHVKKETLMKYFKKYIDDKLLIVRCKIYLPKKYSYILTKVTINSEKKSIFLSGTFINTLTTPELKFVQKYGKILEIYNIAIYDKMIIFKDFVDFFVDKKIEFENKGNIAYRLFCKTILNSLYGKFGQTTKTYIPIVNKKYEFSSKYIIDSINDDDYLIMSLGNRTFEINNTGNNSFDSSVSISSFVTAYARMNLVELILKAKRENVYYVDTDSIIVNEKGFNYLKDDIHKTELGKLKLEEISNDSTYYRPKYYIFNNVEKCKGVKKNAEKVFEDNDLLVIKQELFSKFNTSMRKKQSDRMMVIDMIKNIDKIYDKGIIKNGIVEPYEIKI